MVEDLNSRVQFEKGKQREFFERILKKNNLSLNNLSVIIKVNYSTLKKYYNESLLLPFFLLKRLCNFSKISINSLLIREIKASNWGAIKGGKKGIRVMTKQYGNKLKIWRRKGAFKISRLKEIKIPKLNEELAEFIGAYLGDGTLTKYFVRISGDYRYDILYFNYLSDLIFKLFGIRASIYKEKKRNTAYLIIFSKKLCSFLNKEYKLKYGNKIRNKTIIPQKILKNKKLAVACLRGLIDTDGSVSRRGRKGSQFCVQFTSYNTLLLNQADKIGKKLNIFTYFTGNDVGTNKWENVLKYFKVVGSSNLKHIIRFYLRNYKKETIYLKDVPRYLKKNLYRDMNLPFKLGLWSSG